ncbi:MAG: hypothetical protein WBQ60_10500 [Asticcacaulis sp.]
MSALPFSSLASAGEVARAVAPEGATSLPSTTIAIKLTYWAPNCADLPRLHPDLWPFLQNLSPSEVINWLCERLDRAPNEIALRKADGGTMIFAMAERHARPTPENPAVLMAEIYAGMSFSDLQSARASALQSREAA